MKALKEDLVEKSEKLEKRLKGMKEYLLLKFDEEDWHGVADAAMDIRELIAELKCVKKLSTKIGD